MNAIKRDVYVLKNTIKIPIEVTQGTDMITLEFAVRDYNIPVTAAAVAYAYKGSMRKPHSMLCEVSNNTITFSPDRNFFAAGNNELQIRVIDGEKTLISFKEKVKCTGAIPFLDEEEQNEHPSLVEQLVSYSGSETAERKAADEKEATERKKEIEVERKRIDNLAKLPSGSTSGDAELVDIRIGVNGKPYPNAGEAVRQQINEIDQKYEAETSQLKEDLSEKSPNIASNDITDNVIYGGENILEQNYNTGYCTIVIPFKDEYKGKTLYFSMDGIPVLCRMIRGLIPGNQIDSNFSLSSPAYSFLVPNIETRISRLSFSFGKLQGDYNKIQIEYDCVSKYRPPNITYLSEKGYKYSNFYIPMTSNPNLILSLRDNYIMSLEGTENYNKSYKYTNKIPVSEGDIIFFSNDGAAIEARNVTAYKGNVAVQNKGAERVLMYKVPTDIDSIVITFNASYTKLQAEHDAVTFYNNSRNKVITEDSLYLKNTYKKIANIAEYTPIGLHSFLPSDIYIAHGRTIEIYNHQVCINLSADMHIQWVCTVGNALKRKFRFPSTINIGDYPLTCNIINNKKDVIWTSTVNVHIIDETLDSTIKICPIGDSITNNKSWLAELINLSKGKINFVGTKSLNVKDSNRVARTGGHEGRGGWTAYTYNAKSTKNGESNPFYNSEKGRFDWEYYVTHSLDGNSPDAVIIALGMNDLIYDHTAIKQMIDYIQEDAPKMKIIIQFPQYRANQNGLGVQTNNEGYVTTIGDYEYESDLKIFNFQQNLLEAISGYENVYYSWTTLGFDREYGYAMSQKSVNPRCSFIELVPTESTHPSDEGNFQIADVCYGAIIEATLSTIVEE